MFVCTSKDKVYGTMFDDNNQPILSIYGDQLLEVSAGVQWVGLDGSSGIASLNTRAANIELQTWIANSPVAEYASIALRGNFTIGTFVSGTQDAQKCNAAAVALRTATPAPACPEAIPCEQLNVFQFEFANIFNGAAA